MKLHTARFSNAGCKGTGLPVGIVCGKPKWPTPAEGRFIDELAPDPWCLKMPKAEFEAKYRAKLDKLGVARIRELLERVAQDSGRDDVVLLCYEDLRKSGEWCHRRMFAGWWQEKTGEPVYEVPESALAPTGLTAPRRRPGQGLLF